MDQPGIEPKRRATGVWTSAHETAANINEKFGRAAGMLLSGGTVSPACRENSRHYTYILKL